MAFPVLMCTATTTLSSPLTTMTMMRYQQMKPLGGAAPGGTMMDTCLTLMENTEISTMDKGSIGTFSRAGQFHCLVQE